MCFDNFDVKVVDSELLQPVQRAEDLPICILQQIHDGSTVSRMPSVVHDRELVDDPCALG